VDSRADVYGFGAMLFEILTGELPYDGDGNGEIMRKHVHEAVPRPSSRPGGRWIPPELDQAVMRMMAKRPEDRPQTMHDLAQQWEAVRAVADEAWADWHLLAPSRQRKTLSTVRGSATTGFFDPSQRDPTEELPAGTEVVQLADLGPGTESVLPHALVVDDDVAIRSLLRLILQNAGWTCSTVDGGPASLQWLREHPEPSAVVLDMLMPGMDGLAVLRHMREQGYRGPVVICSTLQSPAIKAEAEAQGGVWFVTKGRELHTIPQVLRDVGVTGLPRVGLAGRGQA
jgi:CheY-like chemotaxis protein